MSNINKDTTKKEQRQEKLNKIVKNAKELKQLIMHSSINNDLKAQILPLVEEIESLCKAQAEALRLSQVVILYELTEKQKGFFKSLYLKEINKIFN